MASIPFWVSLNVTLTASGSGTVQYDVGTKNTFTIEQILQKSAQATNVTDISDSFGNKYGNITASNPMDINAWCDLAADNNVPANVAKPIVIQSNSSINISLVDTSGSGGAVQIVLSGTLDKG